MLLDEGSKEIPIGVWPYCKGYIVALRHLSEPESAEM